MAKRGPKRGSRKATPVKPDRRALRELNTRQKLFVAEYLKDRNATAAYERAGYKARGNAAEVSASQLLRHPQVKAAIDSAVAKVQERTQVSAARLMDELAAIAFANITDVATWTPKTLTLRSSKQIPRHVAAAIAQVEQTKEGVRVRMHSKQAALTALSRFHGPVTPAQLEALMQAISDTMRVFIPPDQLDAAYEFCRQRLAAARVLAAAAESDG